MTGTQGKHSFFSEELFFIYKTYLFKYYIHLNPFIFILPFLYILFTVFQPSWLYLVVNLMRKLTAQVFIIKLTKEGSIIIFKKICFKKKIILEAYIKDYKVTGWVATCLNNCNSFFFYYFKIQISTDLRFDDSTKFLFKWFIFYFCKILFQLFKL